MCYKFEKHLTTSPFKFINVLKIWNTILHLIILNLYIIKIQIHPWISQNFYFSYFVGENTISLVKIPFW